MLNNKKNLMGFMLYGIFNYAQAEVLVILPESGPMARAGLSIKQGFMSAYQASGMKTPIKFVNSDQKPMAQLLKRHVNKSTQMIVGPLARNDVDALIQANLKLRILALNDVSNQAENVWQFSLSKKQDADALNQVLKQDKIKQLYVLRQQGSEAESELFLMSLMGQTQHAIRIVEEVPQKLTKQQGLLLLGQHEWINSLIKLPTQHIYVLANAIEQDQTIPQGVKFCDAPALYSSVWPDLIHAYQQNPVAMSYQRLLALGGDAWQISQQYLQAPHLSSLEFQGRTGLIQMSDHQIHRVPHCYENTQQGLKVL